jgi:hypothetical protein
MPIKRAITRVSPVALLAVLATASLPHRGLAKVNEPESAQQFVRDVVRNEIRSQKGKRIYWRYMEIDARNGTKRLFDVYQTKQGTVKRLLAVNGEPLSPALRQQQQALLQKALNHPSLARKSAKARNQDGDKERKLLAMLPNAFNFRYDGRVGNLVRLDFWPNPSFEPPSREAEVFHHMKGQLLVDPSQMRLAQIDGRLMTEVKFWWGVLGYLDPGGTFLVRQTDVGDGNWQVTRLVVNMNGKALFFKTIGVQENQRFEDYRENPPGMTLREAITQLEKATIPSQIVAR